MKKNKYSNPKNYKPIYFLIGDRMQIYIKFYLKKGRNKKKSDK